MWLAPAFLKGKHYPVANPGFNPGLELGENEPESPKSLGRKHEEKGGKVSTQPAEEAATCSVATRRSRSGSSGAPALPTLYLERISRRPLLTREEEADLGGRSRSGDEGARDLLVKSNLRLVVSVAKKYRGMDRRSRT